MAEDAEPHAAPVPPSARLLATDRVAVLWGGGLGDALALRPLMQRLSARLRDPPLFVCASAGYSGLWDELGVRVAEVRVPRDTARAWRCVRGLGVLDLVYLGPHPTWPTRALASVMRSRRAWAVLGESPDEFIPDTVCRDVRRLGLAEPGEDVTRYGGLPLFRASAPPLAPIAAPYLAVHFTARPHWQAKQWPVEGWLAWLELFLQTHSWEVVCLGSADEKTTIDAALARLPESSRRRVRIETGLPLSQVEQRLRESAGVICHNSGLMHVAVALRKRTVVLTGSPARFWRPAAPWVLNLTSGECALACNQHRCPVPLFRAKCIRSLSVQAVHRAVQSHIAGAAAA
jgi:hypothetical protein